MPHGDQEARADEQVGLAEAHMAIDALRGVRSDEQRIAVTLQLGALVRVLGILDGEVVQAEFLLQLVQQRVLRLVQAAGDGGRLIQSQPTLRR